MRRKPYLCSRCRYRDRCWPDPNVPRKIAKLPLPTSLRGEDLAGFRARYCIPGQLDWTREEKHQERKNLLSLVGGG